MRKAPQKTFRDLQTWQFEAFILNKKKEKKRKKAAAEDTEFGEKDLSLDLGKGMRVAVRTQ